MRQRLIVLLASLVALTGVLGAAAPARASHEIVIGLQCDRTGATQTVGVNLCPGTNDYIALVNAKGGLEGHRVKGMEIDHEYKVPQAMESYERHKKEGAVTIAVYGTPQIYAMEALSGLLFSQAAVLNIIPNLRLILFGGLIIFFLVVEPEGLNRLWRNIRSYFRVWPFAY